MTKTQTVATKHDAIAANIEALVQQLQAGHSEGLTTYLTAIGRFHTYSFGNIIEIARQRPTATRIAGLRSWNQFGRFVKKGEKGIRIFAPMTRKQKEAETAESSETRLIGFRAVYVFDVEQTQGQELPTIDKSISGDVSDYRERLYTFIASQGIEIEFDESIAPASGVSYGGRIALLPGRRPAEEFTTLVHETAHELLHKSDRRASTTKTVRETEAEAVSFVVSSAIGLNVGNASADYIQLYNGDAALLTESLGHIQRAASTILTALIPKEQPEELAQAS